MTTVTESIAQLEQMVGKGQSVLVNSAMEVMDVVAWSRAVTLVVANGAATLVPRSDGSLVRSQHLSIPRPLVVSLNRYVSKNKGGRKFDPDAKIANSLVHIRDNYTCQYCGKSVPKSLATVDHILPRSRGGRSSWSNLCTACQKCNNKKGDMTPQEAGMTVPVIPSWESVNRTKRLQDVVYAVLTEGW